MGPSAIKLGQLLATRPDILGPEVARGLETLQDRLPPFPEAQARKIIELELARPLDRIFAVFGPPVAAASIAQLHEAQTTDDPPRHVAVKIRPGTRRISARLRGFPVAADVAERFSAEARRLRLRMLVETLAASVALELDLRMEAAAASELAQNTRGDGTFHVPAVDWSRTASRVCTSEWVDGSVLRDAETLAAAGHDPKRTRWRCCGFFDPALRDGFSTPTRTRETCLSMRRGRLCRRLGIWAA